MDRCSDPSLVKILVSTAEYQRLLHIERKYLESEKGASSSSHLKPVDSGKIVADQIGAGQMSDWLKTLPELTFDFLLDRGIYAFQNTPTSTSSNKSTVKEQFSKFLSKSLAERFGIPPVVNEGEILLIKHYFNILTYKRNSFSTLI